MDPGDGPTVFDINKPHTYGASPSARPIITGHQPTMPDPMVKARETTRSSGSKITVSIDGDSDKSKPVLMKTGKLDADSLAGMMISDKPSLPLDNAGSIEHQTSSPAILEGEPQLSPPFRPDSDSGSAAQRAPYMPVSDLTGIGATALPKSVNEISEGQVTTTPKPAVFGSHSTPPKKHKGSNHKGSGLKIFLIITTVAAALAGVYAAIDKGLILSNINLPFHIFKKEQPVETVAPPVISQPTIPAGFTATKLLEANLTFAYPSAWGKPTATADQGFTQRKADVKPDQNYAFVVDFATNKDVQLTVTSAKYLSTARPANTALYYDFLQWCIGTADGKYYYGVLKYTTADGVDTPGTVACDQGPLNNAVKINSDTIVQTNLKNVEGGVLGDIYTKNLTEKSYVVARVKDSTTKNSDLIKKLLETIKPLQ